MATRFELLETDEGTPAIRQGDASWRQGGTQKDNPYSMGSREHKEWAEGYALAWHKAADEQAAEADSRKRASELSHARELARIESARAEAVEKRRELRGSGARARSKIRSVSKTITDKLYALGRKYHGSKSEATNAALDAAMAEGLELTGKTTYREFQGNETTIFEMENADGKLYYLTIGTYEMQSGRYELTSYIS